MIGETTITVSMESVREALEEYLNKHFVAEHQTRVVSITRVDTKYGSSPADAGVVVTLVHVPMTQGSQP